ncbi:MAG: hypothetical protein M3N05_01280 [Pseudomonadota bacterium]|nr:hypothetical protein [Pseudomonadota bacterium]
MTKGPSMAARRKIAEHQSTTGHGRSKPTLANRQNGAAPSPALELQSRLAAELEGGRQWSPLATLGFVGATCGGFWAVAAWGLSRLVH